MADQNNQFNQKSDLKVRELNSFDGHLNPNYQSSPDDDHELEYLDAVNSLEEGKESNDFNDESLCLNRKSIQAKLETVVRWNNIEVEVQVKNVKKKILSDVSGEINNLENMAILGPSGAGKSTLLNTIAGRIKHHNGTVNFYSKDRNITFAYVPQGDRLAEMLTVKENLMFASRVKNSLNDNHDEKVKSTLHSFDLWGTRDQYTKKCSGGERKRLSIALEMINNPTILIIDEPTSGLDSTTAYTVIELLKENSISTTVICTIHQPNSNLFQLFDRCYILTEGKCIYNGRPSCLIDDLRNRFDLLCPEFTSPAEFIIEIATNSEKEQGLLCIEKLSKYEQDVSSKKQPKQITDEFSTKRQFAFFDTVNNKEVTLREIDKSSFVRKYNFIREYTENLKRVLRTSIRDPQQTVFRFINNLNFPIMLLAIMNRVIGQETGCPFIPLNETHILKESSYDRYDRQLLGRQDSCSAFINLMFTFFSAMTPACLILSGHINLLEKEYHNTYYSLKSFFWSIITVNVLLAMAYSTANSISFFIFTEYTYEFEKFLAFWIIIFCSGTLGDLCGFVLSCAFPIDRQQISVLVLGSFSGFGIFQLAGFFVQFDTMKSYMQIISKYVFSRSLFESMIRTLYSSMCSVPDYMIFDFDTLKDFINYFNNENKGKLELIGEMAPKVREALDTVAWNRSNILDFLQRINNLNESAMVEINDFWDYRLSYIQNSFDIQGSGIAENLIIMFVTMVFLILIAYSILTLKLRK